MKWPKWLQWSRKTLEQEERDAYNWAAGMLLSGRQTKKQILRSAEICAERNYCFDIRVKVRVDGMCAAVCDYRRLELGVDR